MEQTNTTAYPVAPTDQTIDRLISTLREDRQLMGVITLSCPNFSDGQNDKEILLFANKSADSLIDVFISLDDEFDRHDLK